MVLSLLDTHSTIKYPARPMCLPLVPSQLVPGALDQDRLMPGRIQETVSGYAFFSADQGVDK